MTEVRRDKALSRLRSVLQETENETAPVAATSGDLEAAVHHAYERHLKNLASNGGYAGTTRRTAVGFLVGTASGVATLAITGLLGSIASGALGAAVGGVLDARAVASSKKAHRWLGVLNRIEALAI